MISNQIMVIGGDGYVGRPFCKFLASRGYRVTTFDLKLDPAMDARNFKFDFSEFDYVYILAWDVGGSKYLYQRDAQFRQLDWNVKLLSNLLPQLSEGGVPFLFVSSQLAEEIDTVYGVTKRLGEVWTGLIGGGNVRLWNVYGGLEQVSQRSHVICDFVWQALTSGEIRMMTTGEEMRQFVYMEDAHEALERAISLRLSQGPYDVTSFEWVSILDVANAIASETDAKVIPGEIQGRTPITPIRGKVPGWSPKTSLEKGIRQVVELTRRSIDAQATC